MQLCQKRLTVQSKLLLSCFCLFHDADVRPVSNSCVSCLHLVGCCVTLIVSLYVSVLLVLLIFKPPLAVEFARACVYPSVRLTTKCVHKNMIILKTEQFTVMLSVDNLQECLHGLFKQLKMVTAVNRHVKNHFFGHNSAADGQISLKFYVGKHFFSQNFGSGTDSIFCFPNAVWASASDSFRIVLDTLVWCSVVLCLW